MPNTTSEFLKTRDELATHLKIGFGPLIKEADEWRPLVEHIGRLCLKVETEVRKEALLKAAAIAHAHIGAAKRERIKSKIAPMNFDAEREILAEERGEDIAAERIEKAIRALVEKG